MRSLMRSATDGKSISDLVWCRRGCLTATRSTSGADYYAAAYSVDSWLEILYPYIAHSSPFFFLFRSASWTHPVMFYNLELVFNWTASRRNGYRLIEVHWLNAQWQKYSEYCEMHVFQTVKYHFIYCLRLCEDRDQVLIYRRLHIARVMLLKPPNLCNQRWLLIKIRSIFPLGLLVWSLLV